RVIFILFFFFSSRRRHTRSKRDWSSDVCSSDLVARNIKEIIDTSEYDSDNKGAYKGSLLTRLQSLTNGVNGIIFTCDEISDTEQIGRASCRERVETGRVGGGVAERGSERMREDR